MSVFTLRFRCPGCGHEEVQFEGMYFDSDKCYHIFKCEACDSIRSVAITEQQYNTQDMPLCCGKKMSMWNKCCPHCGKMMVENIICSDFI